MKKLAQTWTLDYIIGLLIFLASIFLGLQILANHFPDNSFQTIYASANQIADTVLSDGFPINWTNETLVIPGFFNNTKLDYRLIEEFHKIDYSESKTLFGTNLEYSITFQDQYFNPLYFDGNCSLGSPNVSFKPNINFTNVAYYFPTIGVSRYMQDPMNDTFNADFYYRDGNPGDNITNDGRTFTIAGGLDHLIQNLSSYHVIFLEHPGFGSYSGENITLNDIKSSIANWLEKGHYLYISELVGAGTWLNITFNDLSSDGSNPATIINQTDHLPFEISETVQFQNRFTIETTGSESNFVHIGNYSGLSKIAVAAWTYGLGNVYYVSDLDADYNSYSNLSIPISDSIQKIAWGKCQELTFPSSDNSVRVRRLGTFNDEPVYVVVDVWEND